MEQGADLLQQPQVAHAHQGFRGRAVFGQQPQFVTDARPREPLEDVQAHGVLDEAFGLAADPELETLLEADGADDARRVLHEGQGVQHADDAVLDVLLAAEEVHEAAKGGRAEVDGQGIDGEVPAVEVHLERREFHDGQGGRVFIVFEPGRGHVDLLSRGQDEHGRAEFEVGPHAGVQPLAQGVGKGHAVALHHQVDVVVGDAQEHVAHEAAHGVDFHARLLARPAGQLQEGEDVAGQAFVHEMADVLFLALFREQGLGDARGFLDHEVDEVRAGDDADHVVVAQHGHQTLATTEDDLHDLVEVLLLGHEEDVLLHVLGHALPAQAVPHGLFRQAPLDDAADLVPELDHGQGLEAVAHHDLGGFGHLAGRLDAHHGRGHEGLDHELGIDVGVKQGKKFILYLRNGAILDGGRRRIGVPAAAEGGADHAHVDLGRLAAGHELDAVAHAPDGEEHADVFHVHELVGQQGEVAHVGFQGDFGQDDLHAVYGMGGGRFDEFREDGHLFRGQLAAHDVPDDVEVHAHGPEPGRGLEVVLRGGLEGEPARVLEDAQAHDGGLVGGDAQSFPAQFRDDDGRGGAPWQEHVDDAGQGVVGFRVMVVEVDLKVGPVQKRGHVGQARALACVHHDEGADEPGVYIL